MSIEDSDAALRIVEAGRQRVLARMRDAFAHQAAAHTDLGEIDPAVLDRLVHEAADQAGTSVWRIALAEGAVDEFGGGLSEALAHPAVAAAEQLVGPAEDLTTTTAAAPVAPPEPAAPEPVATPEPVAAALEPAAPEPITAPEPAVAPDPWESPESEEAADAAEEEEHAAPGTWGGPASDPEPSTAVHEPVPEPEPEPEPEPPAAAPEPATATAAEGSAGQPQALRIPAVHTSGIETLKQGDKDLELRLSDAGLDVLRQSTGVAIGRLDWAEITNVEIEQTKKGLRGRKRSQTLQVKTARGQATFELPGLTDEESSEHLQPMLDRLRDSGLLSVAPD
jgi:hypothetical protein